MSQRVPSWDLDENPNCSRDSLRSRSNSTKLNYEVAELTWENGQLAMHGLGPPRVPAKPAANNSSPTWEKPHASGTLESIVNQATSLPQRRKPPLEIATVPCSNRSQDPVPGLGGTCVVDCSTRVGSCSGPVATKDEEVLNGKRPMVARVPVGPEWSSRDHSVSGSATFGRDSQHVTHDTYDMDMGVGFTSTSTGSPENTSSAKQGEKATTADDHDSVHSRPPREVGDEGNKKKEKGKTSISTKRSRAAAIHNQSERKRRDKINQRMKTLQKLVPNSSQTDKASMLDEVIDYLKQLQAQVSMMSRMNMQPMMLPTAMQQQLQMSMMAPMSMGMRMGMGMGMGVMDMNSMNRPNISSMPPVVPRAPFLHMALWDGSSDRLQVSAMADPLATFLAFQTQPMTMDAYSRIAAMYQQMQQPPESKFQELTRIDAAAF